MADLLQTGSAWLESQRTSHCAGLVEYRRSETTTEVHATYGMTKFEVADESGLTVNSHVWDFLILAEELGFEPVAGDVVAANGRQYEVMPLAGDGCWRWSDPYRVTFRIHTKDLGADT